MINTAIFGQLQIKSSWLQDNGVLLYSKKEHVLHVSVQMFERFKVNWQETLKEKVQIWELPEFELPEPSQLSFDLGYEPSKHYEWKHTSQQLMHW